MRGSLIICQPYMCVCVCVSVRGMYMCMYVCVCRCEVGIDGVCTQVCIPKYVRACVYDISDLRPCQDIRAGTTEASCKTPLMVPSAAPNRPRRFSPIMSGPRPSAVTGLVAGLRRMKLGNIIPISVVFKTRLTGIVRRGRGGGE